MKTLAGFAAWAMAFAAAAQDGVSVAAAGLDRFEGAQLEIGYTDPRLESGFGVLGVAAIENGEANLTFALSEPLPVELKVHGAEPSEGLRARGVVEPGVSHRVVWNPQTAALEFSGGRYDRLIRLALAEAGETGRLALRYIYLNDPDPQARLMALHAGWRDGEDEQQQAVLNELESLLGDSLTIGVLKGLAEQRAEQVARAIKAFAALDLDGEEVRFADVLAENRYTLLEFWASWCAPCIVEIPNLKAAYERFRGRGFEILAFNLDDFREDWRQASEDDYDIPWLNVSDELAFGSPFAQALRVNAIPASLLVSADGSIVGRNLHGDALEGRLEALLGGEADPRTGR